MLGGLLNILAPPLTSDYGVGRMKIYVRVILITVAACFSLVFVLNTDVGSKVASIVLLLYALTCLLFFVRDNITIPRVSIPLILYTVCSILIWRGFGLHSVTVPALTLVIVFSALLASRWASFLYMVLSMTTLAVVLYAEHQGWVANGLERPSTVVELLNLYLALAALTIALSALMRHMEVDRDNARDSESAARRLNEELQVQSSTLRKQQTALALSESQYRLLSDNIHDFIWTTDLELNYTFSSPSSERILGYTPKEIVGMSLFETLAPEWIEYVVATFADETRLEQEGTELSRHRSFEIQTKRKDGSLLWVEANVSFLRDDTNAAIGIVGTTRDISDRKQAEADKLEVEDQLRQSQKLESIGQLAGGIAHDFNNTIQGIVTFTHLAADTAVPEDVRARHLQEILKAAGQASELTKQLLAVSRRQVLRPEKFDLNEVIDESLNMLRRVVRKDVGLALEKSEGPATIEADPGQLNQILMNLTVNARDAMPTGGNIVIRTEEVVIDEAYCTLNPWAKPGSYICLSYSDTGSGMDADTRLRVFEPFYTTKLAGEGTGLGLATVYGIVKQHQGLIHVYSEVGKGTQFKIYWPRSEAEEKMKIELDDSEATRGGTETILIAEDEPAIRESMQMVLELAGYRVYPTEDGKQAIEFVRSHEGEISLAILDVIMPETGGLEASKGIASIDDNVRFLFSSGYSADSLDREFLSRDTVNLIEKPYDPSKLLQKVREVLDSH